jgi:hypothetical protein
MGRFLLGAAMAASLMLLPLAPEALAQYTGFGGSGYGPGGLSYTYSGVGLPYGSTPNGVYAPSLPYSGAYTGLPGTYQGYNGTTGYPGYAASPYLYGGVGYGSYNPYSAYGSPGYATGIPYAGYGAAGIGPYGYSASPYAYAGYGAGYGGYGYPGYGSYAGYGSYPGYAGYGQPTYQGYGVGGALGPYGY